MKLDNSFKPAYKQASKSYDIAVNQWNDQKESKLCSDPNSKKLFNFINGKLKARHFIPPLKNSSGDLIFSDIDKANLLTHLFNLFLL